MSRGVTAGRIAPRPIAAADGRPLARRHAALRRYLVAVAAGNLVWEFAQMPFYTIWSTGTWKDIVFAALHCTGGDILIALSSLTIALLSVGNGAWPDERFWPVAALTIALGVSYTVFSEWLNVVVRSAWAYSDLMPVLPLFGFKVGLFPLLQWIVLPLLAFGCARRSTRCSGTT